MCFSKGMVSIFMVFWGLSDTLKNYIVVILVFYIDVWYYSWWRCFFFVVIFLFGVIVVVVCGFFYCKDNFYVFFKYVFDVIEEMLEIRKISFSRLFNWSLFFEMKNIYNENELIIYLMIFIVGYDVNRKDSID